MFGKYTELFNKLELEITEACSGRAHKIGKKTPGRVSSTNNFSFHDMASPQDGLSFASIVGSLLT